MTENEYLIKIVLGDPSGDGHGRTNITYFITNKSPKQIQEALNKVKLNIGFDILSAFDDYQKSNLTESEYKEIYSKYNVDNIFDTYTYQRKNRETGELYDYTTASFKGDSDCILFEIAKLELPDLIYEVYEIEIDGEFEYGYGFFD